MASKEYHHQYYQKNKEKLKERASLNQKLRYENDYEGIMDYQKQYKKDNPDKIKRITKKAYKKRFDNPIIREQMNKKSKHFYDTNFGYWLKRNYNITMDEYNSLLEKQDFKCAICGSSDSKRKDSKRLVVDHCHETEKVRGLLCNLCNTGLGNFEDNPRSLDNAIKYLVPTDFEKEHAGNLAWA